MRSSHQASTSSLNRAAPKVHRTRGASIQVSALPHDQAKAAASKILSGAAALSVLISSLPASAVPVSVPSMPPSVAVTVPRFTNEFRPQVAGQEYRPQMPMPMPQQQQMQQQQQQTYIPQPQYVPPAPVEAPKPQFKYEDELTRNGIEIRGGLCSLGREQSPINIDVRNGTDRKNFPITLDWVYKPSTASVKLTNDGPRVFPSGDQAVIGGVPLQMLQYHFHAPAEHRLNGKLYDAEAHLVHALNINGEQRLAVVGVFIKADENAPPNPALGFMLENAKRAEKEGRTEVQGGVIDPLALLPATRAVYSYTGSLTTAPCSEGVEWFVLAEPIRVPPAQVLALLKENGEKTNSGFSVDNRSVMPLNGRIVHSWSVLGLK